MNWMRPIEFRSKLHWMITRPSKSKAALAFAALVLASANKASGFEEKGYSWNFEKNPIETHFIICENNAPVGASKLIQQAAAKWNYSKLHINFDEDDCPAQRPINYVEFTEFQDKGETGFTATRNDGTKEMKSCRIQFNKDKFWNLSAGAPDKDENDLFSVALHEFGHCVGLDDLKAPGSVMQGRLNAGEMLRELTPDDVAGRNKIYGAP
ncbi:matrixin family metalloprotease [Rhizobium leguminosarum]|uniref:matrixin family metalloprotease n=1 Tax=Rhizobium leguminosarum TaxID=384 RepID=UPI001C9722B6|nr:matrixin family metalloprotease [Rhizobium leguminosarum]MBY5579143.1 matrixin family metalloprotease [Rhizobium leguminosarum]